MVELGAAMSCACVAELHGVSIMPDLLKKKLWKGQSGASQGFSSFMQLARPHFRPATAESGRASPLCDVLTACFKLLENLDRATDEMGAEKSTKDAKDARTEAGEQEINETINGDKGKRSKKGPKKGGTQVTASTAAPDAPHPTRRTPPPPPPRPTPPHPPLPRFRLFRPSCLFLSQSRSPVTALTNLGMPNLVQKAWRSLSDRETAFYADHPRPALDEDEDAARLSVPGWSYKEETKEWRKVDRHMLDEYQLILDEADSDWTDDHKMYTEWISKQSAATKTTLALMLVEVQSVPGADAQTEMGEIAKSMQTSAQAQAAAMEAGALARERASAHKEDTRAETKKGERIEREAARKGQEATTGKIIGLIADFAKSLPGIIHPPQAAAPAAAAPPPPPPAAPDPFAAFAASGRRQARSFDSLEALLTSAVTATFAAGMQTKFDDEGYTLVHLQSAWGSGEDSVARDLRELGICLADRRSIINALDPANHL